MVWRPWQWVTSLRHSITCEIHPSTHATILHLVLFNCRSIAEESPDLEKEGRSTAFVCCMASMELHDLKFSPVMWNFWCMQTQGPSTAIWLNDETLRGTNAIDGIWFTWNCRIMIAQAPKVACAICSLRKWCMQICGPKDLQFDWLIGRCAIWSDWLMCKLIWLTDGIWFTWNCRIMIAQAPKVACAICSLRKWCMQICGPKDMQSDWLISRCAIWSDWLMCKLIWLTDAQSDLIDCCAIWLMDVQYDKNLENPKEIL